MTHLVDVPDEVMNEIPDVNKQDIVDFRQEMSQDGGSSSTERLFNVLNNKHDEAHKNIACKAGCDACCHQLVLCTETEALEIRAYLKGLSRRERRSLYQDLKLKSQVSDWKSWVSDNSLRIHADPGFNQRAWWGKRCVFLDSTGSCSIHPVRPLDCRTYVNSRKCSMMEGGLFPEPKRFTCKQDMIAVNEISKINKEEASILPQGVYPLPQWLLIFKQALGL